MQKRTLLVTLLCVIAITIGLGLTWFRNKEAVSMPRRPEETLKEIIKKNVKQEFLPSTYKITDRPEYLQLVFGEDVNYFFTEWDTERARFVALTEYNKTTSKELVGYEILIFIKEPDLTGKELAYKFLNSFPTEKWSHKSWGEIEISTGISVTDHNKIYVNIWFYNFLKPRLVPYFPNESIRRMGIIGYGVCMPNNPYYSEIGNFQEHPLQIFHP